MPELAMIAYDPAVPRLTGAGPKAAATDCWMRELSAQRVASCRRWLTARATKENERSPAIFMACGRSDVGRERRRDEEGEEAAIASPSSRSLRRFANEKKTGRQSQVFHSLLSGIAARVHDGMRFRSAGARVSTAMSG